MTDSHAPTALMLWVVTKHPSDFPDKFVARPNYVGPKGHYSVGAALTADTLEDLRAKLPQGLHRMARWADDDPVIVEVWL